MIPKHIADWLSPLLGLLGSLALAIPYFNDVRIRILRKTKLRDFEKDKGVYEPEVAEKFGKRVEKVRTEAVLAPDIVMTILAAGGCCLLVLSFLVLLLASPG